MGLGTHLDHGVFHNVRLERREALVAAANHLVGDRRRQETHRGTDTCRRGHQHRFEVEFARDVRGVDRRGTAERDQRSAGDLLAPVGGMSAGGGGHVLVDHLRDGMGPGLNGPGSTILHPRLGNVAIDHVARRVDVEDKRPASEPVRVEEIEDDVGVGYGGMPAAAPVAGRTRFGSGALRPDLDSA